MPRKSRKPSSTGVYHWMVRGMNKKRLFHDPSDFSFFKNLILQYITDIDLLVYHYCLMSNHAHLLLWSEDLVSLKVFSQYVQRRYAYYYCKQRRASGSIFQQRYRSIPVEDSRYLLECGRYIERNPIKAGLVTSPGDYVYSSYRFYVEGTPDELLTASPAYQGLSGDEVGRRELYRKYVTEERIQEEMIERNAFAL